MRKHWLAVLSILGLSGSSTPASAQVLKGAKDAGAKSESTLKSSKQSQEDAASKDAMKAKWQVKSVEGGKATSDAAAMKYRKAGGEQAVQASGIYKGQKANAELKANQGTAAYKEQKAANENSATAVGQGGGGGAGKVAQQDIIRHKAEKNASELKATQNEATIKLTNAQQKKQINSASPKK